MTRTQVTTGPSRGVRFSATVALIALLWFSLAGRSGAQNPQVVQASPCTALAQRGEEAKIEKGDIVFPIAPFEIKTIGIVFR